MMDKLNMVTFQDLFATPLRNGLTRPKSVRGQGTKMVNMGEIFAYSRIGDIDMDRVLLSEKETLEYLLEPDDLLFARQSLVLSGAGKCSIILKQKEPATFESHIIRARLNKNLTEPIFYYYFFNSAMGRQLIKSIVEQVAAAGIRGSDLARLKVPYLPLPEQYAIARVLSTLDDKIELNRQMNKTLESMARAIFKAWFVDFDPVRAKMEGHQPYGMDAETAALFPDSFEDSVHGELPKGWRILPLEKTIDFLEGPGIRHWQYTNSEEGTRFINIRCIQNRDLILDTANRVSDEEAYSKYKHFLLNPGDVVVSTSGTLGRFAVVREKHLPLLLNTSVIRMRPISHILSNEYLLGYIESDQFQYELETRASGSVQRNFGPMHLKQMMILVPSWSILSKHSKVVSPIFQRILSNMSENSTLVAIRDVLLPKLLSGEIRVKDTENYAEAHL